MTPEQAQSIAAAKHLIGLLAAPHVYFYWGDDENDVLERAARFEIVLIGANLDTKVLIFKEPAEFPPHYPELARAIGHRNLHFYGGPQ